jgi:hypothetical protein
MWFTLFRNHLSFPRESLLHDGDGTAEPCTQPSNPFSPCPPAKKKGQKDTCKKNETFKFQIPQNILCPADSRQTMVARCPIPQITQPAACVLIVSVGFVKSRKKGKKRIELQKKGGNRAEHGKRMSSGETGTWDHKKAFTEQGTSCGCSCGWCGT